MEPIMDILFYVNVYFVKPNGLRTHIKTQVVLEDALNTQMFYSIACDEAIENVLSYYNGEYTEVSAYVTRIKSL
jgi:hypothetical protein